MKIEVHISDQPLRLDSVVVPGCGAMARFDGLVRGLEDGQPITGLHYDAYQPMAENTIRRLLEGLHEQHPFELARVHHRIGWVPVGEAAIMMDVHAKHRAEAFLSLQKFMDLLKREVPIWKASKKNATFRVAMENP